MKKKFIDFFSNITEKRFWVGILVFMLGQSLTYYGIKLFEMSFHTFDSSIDKMIPFIPEMITIYSIWYPFIFFTLYYIYRKDYNVFKNGIIIGTIGYLIADIIFLAYPTVIIRPEVAYESLDPLTSLLIYITYNGDNPAINCFPSIHCLYCFQIMLMFFMLKKEMWQKRMIVTSISLLIVASTVLVKQHYFFDILCSLGLALSLNSIGYLIINNVKLKENKQK